MSNNPKKNFLIQQSSQTLSYGANGSKCHWSTSNKVIATGGNQKNLMRQMEAMKGKSGGMGGMPGF